MRKSILIIAAAVMAIPAAPAAADPPSHAPAYGYREHHERANQDRRTRPRIYDDNGRYIEPRRVSRGDDIWEGRDGRNYCRRDNGTTGLIIGAGGGALLGHEVDRNGDRIIGTVVGAVLGGLLGREIDRGGARCR